MPLWTRCVKYTVLSFSLALERLNLNQNQDSFGFDLVTGCKAKPKLNILSTKMIVK